MKKSYRKKELSENRKFFCMENELALRFFTGDISAKCLDGNYRNFNWNFANDFQETFKNFSSQLKKNL